MRVLLAAPPYPGGDRIAMLVMEDKDGSRDGPERATVSAMATLGRRCGAIDLGG